MSDILDLVREQVEKSCNTCVNCARWKCKRRGLYDAYWEIYDCFIYEKREERKYIVNEHTRGKEIWNMREYLNILANKCEAFEFKRIHPRIILNILDGETEE